MTIRHLPTFPLVLQRLPKRLPRKSLVLQRLPKRLPRKSLVLQHLPKRHPMKLMVWSAPWFHSAAFLEVLRAEMSRRPGNPSARQHRRVRKPTRSTAPVHWQQLRPPRAGQGSGHRFQKRASAWPQRRCRETHLMNVARKRLGRLEGAAVEKATCVRAGGVSRGLLGGTAALVCNSSPPPFLPDGTVGVVLLAGAVTAQRAAPHMLRAQWAGHSKPAGRTVDQLRGRIPAARRRCRVSRDSLGRSPCKNT